MSRKRKSRARVAERWSWCARAVWPTAIPRSSSGGQQQRVALARAIICQPRLILLDEPLGALDAELRRQMQRFLKRLQREIRTTFLFVTHDQEEAITMADRICVMNAGRIVQIGSPQEVYYRPAQRICRALLRRQQPDRGASWPARSGGRRIVDTAAGPLRLPDRGRPSRPGDPIGQPAKLRCAARGDRISPTAPTATTPVGAGRRRSTSSARSRRSCRDR